jgi:outer membrane protein OmpA-like peptidoglycan-associated protein
MRELIPVIFLSFCAAVPAAAQVSVDLHALEPLPAHNAPAPRPVPHPPRPKVTTSSAATSQPRPPPPAATAASASPPAPEAPVAVPPTPAAAPPAPAAPVPAVDIPAAPPPGPTPAPTQTASLPPAAAASKAALANLRLPFAADQTDLSKESVAAIEGMLRTAYAGGPPAFTVIAYAAGTADDPSSARRLSLARAMAARTELMNQGVPSRRITVRALGSQAAGGPPDRVDISAAPSEAP